jgi:adenylate cyclase
MTLTSRHIRLASGLVLLTYVTLHLINHALAIWSLALAERGLTWSIALWQSAPGTILLYGAAGAHFMLACHTIYARRHWRLPPIEWIRLWAGFSLPLLLIGHVVSTRLAVTLEGAAPDYRTVVTNLVRSGSQGWQLALLAPGWLHGCLGLWLTLRRFAMMRRARPILVAVVVLVPLASALGFLHMEEVIGTAGNAPAPAAALVPWRQAILAGYLALIAAAFVAGRMRVRRSMVSSPHGPEGDA